jgi:ankyrin repeat protein
MFAIAWYDDPKAAALFQKHGAKITEKNGKDTPFMAAMGWKKFKVAEWFLANGADVEITDELGNTSLLLTVKKKYPLPVIKMLIKYGADPDKQNKKGESAHKIASSYRDKSIFKILS